MRLIDADAFLASEIERCGTVPYIGLCLTSNKSFKEVLDEQPTVDAEKCVEQPTCMMNRAKRRE